MVIQKDTAEIQSFGPKILPHEWRRIFYAASVILSASVLAFIALRSIWDPEDPISSALAALITALLGALYVACFVEILRIVTRVARMKEVFDAHFDRMDRRLNSNLSQFEEVLTRTYGLHTRDGLEKILPKIEEAEIFLGEDVKAVSWINTKFADTGVTLQKIDEALERGINIRLLLMHAESKCVPMRAREIVARYKDEAYRQGEVDGYLTELQACQDRVIRFVHGESNPGESKRENAPNRRRGKFQVRFYKDLPATPMMFIEIGQRHEEAYTGFYLNDYSRNLPYIQWRSATSHNVLDAVKDYFEKKWYFASSDDASEMKPSEKEKSSAEEA